MKISAANWYSKWWLREPLMFALTFYIFMYSPAAAAQLEGFQVRWLALFSIYFLHAEINQYLLLPIWLRDGRPARYLVWTIILVIAFSYVSYHVEYWMFRELIDKEPLYECSFDVSIKSVLSSLLVISGFAFIRMMHENREREQQQKLLLHEMENHVLRAQANPHFLFNALNNLYGVSLEQPERAPELILQLAGLMRYSVETSRRETVELAEELAFLRAYVALETERVGQRCAVILDEKATAPTAQIAPMLLVPLVENAFKHGTATVEKCWIELRIGTDATGRFFVQARNSMPSKKAKIQSTGVGLENTRARLERLYPKRHELRIGEKSGVFEAFLAINL